MVGIPEAFEGARADGRAPDHLGRLPRVGREFEFLPDACWQRCVVHFYRNVFSHVPRPKMREVAAMLKAIHASEDVAAAREKALQVVAKLPASRLSKAAELVETDVAETLAYYAFPEAHWRRVRTNNPLERILREIRRRSRVVGPSLMGNQRWTWRRPACATSPAASGRPKGI